MTRTAKPVEQLYTVHQVAELLAVNRTTVWRLIKKGRESGGRDGIWPVVNLGRRTTRVPSSSVNAWLQRIRKWAA